MKLTRRSRMRVAAFDMTPMIDVVLQLIIFFMVTSQFSKMVRSEVDLPKETGQENVEQDSDVLIVDVRADGALMVESRPVTRERFIAMISAELNRVDGDGSRVKVLVRADRNATAGAVSQVALDLNKMGVRAWRVGTERVAGSAP